MQKLSATDIDQLSQLNATPTFGLAGKHSTRRNVRITEPVPIRRSRRTAAHRAVERPPVVSRSMRRFHNDMLLMTTAVEIDALPSTRSEFRSLFETSTTSHWTILSQDEDAAAVWTHFNELDEDTQNGLLNQQSPKKQDTKQARTALNRVDRRLRHLFKSRTAVVKPLVKELEEQVFALPPGQSVVLKLPHALYRMVAHGVAQFHAMGHRSLGEGDKRVTVIHASNNWSATAGPRLMDVLG